MIGSAAVGTGPAKGGLAGLARDANRTLYAAKAAGRNRTEMVEDGAAAMAGNVVPLKGR